jgi:hypothetical protein
VRLAARPEVAPQHPADDELRQVPRVTAAIVARIQGGVLMMMFTGDTTPLEAALDLAIGYLQANPVR